MLFNSFEFLVFLLIVFLLYWLVFKGLNVQNIFIVAVSYIFYGWWDCRFLIIIFLITLLSFWSGILIDKYWNRRKLICGVNIGINLAILCYFKYANFFTNELYYLLNQIGFLLFEYQCLYSVCHL